MLKRYKFGFDIWALALFAAVMLPNFYWFAVPAPNDILRSPSVTPVMDRIASVLQVIMVAALCLIKRADDEAAERSIGVFFTALFYVVYIGAWVLYYMGHTDGWAIIALCLAPCLTFGSYGAHRKNYPAMVPLLGFAVCHLAYGVINFIL